MNIRTKNVGSILEGLNNSKVSQYGRLVNEEEYKTIAGIRTRVDKDGKVIDEKDKKIIEKRLGKSIGEVTKEDETEREIDEDEWKTMHGAHVLIDGEGDIIAGGPEHLRKKASKKEIEAGVKDADAKSKEAAKGKPKK